MLQRAFRATAILSMRFPSRPAERYVSSETTCSSGSPTSARIMQTFHPTPHPDTVCSYQHNATAGDRCAVSLVLRYVQRIIVYLQPETYRVGVQAMPRDAIRDVNFCSPSAGGGSIEINLSEVRSVAPCSGVSVSAVYLSAPETSVGVRRYEA